MGRLKEQLDLLWRAYKERVPWNQIETQATQEFRISLVGESSELLDLWRAYFLGGTMVIPSPRAPIREVPLPLDPEKEGVLRGSNLILYITPLKLEDLFEKGEFLAKLASLATTRILVSGENDSPSQGALEPGWLDLPYFRYPSDFTSGLSRGCLLSILNALPTLELAVGRQLPAFRREVARRLILKTSFQNLLIALASALPGHFPIVGIILGPFAAAGDTLLLTTNQVKLLFQLACIHGREMNFQEMLKELTPLIGSALGWRTLARELVGFVPVAGPVIKAVIGYAGTYAAGVAAAKYYRTGALMSREEFRKSFQTASTVARKKATEVLSKMRRKGGGKRLP
ncbi:MAG: hypothetical protein HYU64_00340 [Armatimonadetes bacterium]|nr:hypothetical protein [Armatimonadota bacterium]